MFPSVNMRRLWKAMGERGVERHRIEKIREAYQETNDKGKRMKSDFGWFQDGSGVEANVSA